MSKMDKEEEITDLQEEFQKLKSNTFLTGDGMTLTNCTPCTCTTAHSNLCHKRVFRTSSEFFSTVASNSSYGSWNSLTDINRSSCGSENTHIDYKSGSGECLKFGDTSQVRLIE